MKEWYVEGLATHDGPESCAASRKGSGEALTGVRAGWILSREAVFLATPTPWRCGEGKTGRVDIARRSRVLRGLRPRARTEKLRTRTGRLCARPQLIEPWAVSGSPRTDADDERAQEVGRTDEVSERGRAIGGGADGGRGPGQRESAPAKRTPDSEPARRAHAPGPKRTTPFTRPISSTSRTGSSPDAAGIMRWTRAMSDC
jgi:hypothetical protein